MTKQRINPFIICTDYFMADTVFALRINGKTKGRICTAQELGCHYPDDFISEVNIKNPNITECWMSVESNAVYNHIVVFNVYMDTQGKEVRDLTKEDMSFEI